MMENDIKKQVWNKAGIIEGLNPDMYRKDACGAIMMYDKFMQQNPYGWVIDHILPRILGGDDNLLNLRALHYLNDMSKKDDYPTYYGEITSQGLQNIPAHKMYRVNDKLRSKLRDVYPGA